MKKIIFLTLLLFSLAFPHSHKGIFGINAGLNNLYGVNTPQSVTGLTADIYLVLINFGFNPRMNFADNKFNPSFYLGIGLGMPFASQFGTDFSGDKFWRTKVLCYNSILCGGKKDDTEQKLLDKLCLYAIAERVYSKEKYWLFGLELSYNLGGL